MNVAALARLPASLSRAAVALAIVAWSTASHAQASQAQATAEALFEDGRRLMTEGKYAEACPKLAESQRLDPGGGTVLNLALCHEAEGRTASAWAEFKEAVGWAIKDGRTNREKLAREHIAVLEPKLVRLSIKPVTAVKGLEIRVDGVAVGQGAWGTATPVDPGEHQIEASAPHFYKWSSSVTVENTPDNRVELEVPALKPLPPELDKPVGGDTTPPMSATRRNAIIASYGVGAVGIAGGVVLTLMTLSARSDSNQFCGNGDTKCSKTGVELNNDAIRYSWYATGAFGLGVAGAAVGTYLLLTAPKRGSHTIVTPQVGTNGGGLSLTHSF